MTEMFPELAPESLDLIHAAELPVTAWRQLDPLVHKLLLSEAALTVSHRPDEHDPESFRLHQAAVNLAKLNQSAYPTGAKFRH